MARTILARTLAAALAPLFSSITHAGASTASTVMIDASLRAADPVSISAVLELEPPVEDTGQPSPETIRRELEVPGKVSITVPSEVEWTAGPFDSTLASSGTLSSRNGVKS